eukprot:1151962-Pelagomonas_calceolata.AAC.3
MANKQEQVCEVRGIPHTFDDVHQTQMCKASMDQVCVDEFKLIGPCCFSYGSASISTGTISRMCIHASLMDHDKALWRAHMCKCTSTSAQQLHIWHFNPCLPAFVCQAHTPRAKPRRWAQLPEGRAGAAPHSSKLHMESRNRGRGMKNIVPEVSKSVLPKQP